MYNIFFLIIISIRSYQLIATASKDTRVRIYKLTGNKDGFKVDAVAEFLDHDREVIVL